MEYIIYNKSGEELTTVSRFTLDDTDMGTSAITMSLTSPTPIDFGNGDYLIFRNEKYTLNYIPSVKRQARTGSYGEAFVYDNIIFNSCRDELTRCMFYDVVENDNGIPYTSSPSVTFTDSGLAQIKMRVQANLDRVYGEGAWEVFIQDGAIRKDGDPINDYNYSFSSQSVWEVLVQMSSSQDVNFTVRNIYAEDGAIVDRKIITLGATHDVAPKDYAYGKGNGFKSIEAQSQESEQVITVLHAYGNTQNMPYRYYNHLVDGHYDKDKDWDSTHPLASLYMPNLSLPGFGTKPTGTVKYYNRDLAEGLEVNYAFAAVVTFYDVQYNVVKTRDDAAFAFVQRVKTENGSQYVYDTYLQSLRSYGRYGYKEGDKYFNSDDDENGYDDIYPSAKWLTDENGDPVAVVTNGDDIADNGVPLEDGTIDVQNFTIDIADVGFNVRDDNYGADAVPQLVMTSGMCTSRTFDISDCVERKDNNGNVIGYTLTCVRTKDEAIDRYFPYSDYHIKAGDTFAFLNIQMPYVYVEKSAEQLLKEGLKYLAAHDTNTITLKPEMDNIFLAKESGEYRLADLLRSGLRLNIVDDDIAAYTPLSGLTISQLRIEVGNSLIDEYEVTLASDKEADMLSRVVSEVKNYFAANNSSSSLRIITSADGTPPSDHSVYSSKRTDKQFLRKDVSDRSAGTISSDKGFEGGEFKQNVSGVGIYKDSEGVWHIETDVLSVRRKLVAKTLEIQEVKHIGGQTMLTAAGNTIACVVEHVDEQFFRCYFPKSDNGKAVTNTWEVGDQAYCQMFNLANNNGTAESRFYWRLVTATSNGTTDDTTTIEVDGVEVDASGYHFIDLSCDDPGVSGGYIDGSDVPQAGDKVVQLGYRGDDTDRQNAIIAAGAGGGSPYIYLFYGIKTFELPSDPDRLKPNDNKLTGQLTITAGSSGASNLSDFATAVQEKIRVGARNLLRNSGFTGDYLSEQLSDTKELDADSPLWSDALDHWTTEGTITINEDKSAVSGYSAHIEGGSISQTVDENVAVGDTFVLSFYLQGSVEYEFGGVSGTLRNGVGTFEKPKLQTVYLTAETAENTLRIADKTTTDAEGMTSIADGTIYDLQLERGNVATEWSHNYLDNSSDRAYYQSLKYLSGALRGSTSINGGLILTNVIELGNYTDNEQTDVTAGLSGTRSDNSVSEDVAFWGGGTLEEAIKALAKYGTTNTTQTESGLAQAVIGHNGTAVFNNIHINGSGTFTGAVTITGGQSKTDIDNALQGVSDNKDSITTLGEQIAAIAANFSDLDYLKKALAQSTTIEGGVVATSLLLLGSKDASGNYNALAGLSGIDSVNDGTGVALFFGGNPYANGTSTKADESLAKAVFRFDGSGFLAGGTLSWSKNGFITSKSPFMERWVDIREYIGVGGGYTVDYSLGANIKLTGTNSVYTLATPSEAESATYWQTCFMLNVKSESMTMVLQADTNDFFHVTSYDSDNPIEGRYIVLHPQYSPYQLEAYKVGSGVRWQIPRRNCGYCHTETRTIGGTDYSVIVVGDTKEQSFTIGTKKYSFSNGILVKVTDIDDGGTGTP